MVDNVCTRAYMQFDLICLHFPHTKDLKWIFSNVKINSESISNSNLQRFILMNIHFNS